VCSNLLPSAFLCWDFTSQVRAPSLRTSTGIPGIQVFVRQCFVRWVDIRRTTLRLHLITFKLCGHRILHTERRPPRKKKILPNKQNKRHSHMARHTHGVTQIKSIAAIGHEHLQYEHRLEYILWNLIIQKTVHSSPLRTKIKNINTTSCGIHYNRQRSGEILFVSLFFMFSHRTVLRSCI